METYDEGNTAFRVVRYKDTSDTFLEVHNSKWNLIKGSAKFKISMNVDRNNYRAELSGERLSDAYSHTFTDENNYLALLGMIGQSRTVSVENSNNATIAKFGGNGSGLALQNYGDCLKNNWRLEARSDKEPTMNNGSGKILASYVYSSGKNSGNMIIRDISACEIQNNLGCMSAIRPLRIEIKTSNNDTGSDCDLVAFEETSGRIAEPYGMTVLMTIQDPRSGGKPNLSIKFDKSNAFVQPQPEAFALGCGAGVSYDGQWRLKSN